MAVYKGISNNNNNNDVVMYLFSFFFIRYYIDSYNDIYFYIDV